jgi:hypothetical protein
MNMGGTILASVSSGPHNRSGLHRPRSAPCRICGPRSTRLDLAVVGLWGLQLFLHGVANALGGTGLGFHHFLGGVPSGLACSYPRGAQSLLWMVYAATSSAFMPIWIGVDVLNPGLIGLGVGRLVLAVLAVLYAILLFAGSGSSV